MNKLQTFQRLVNQIKPISNREFVDSFEGSDEEMEFFEIVTEIENLFKSRYISQAFYKIGRDLLGFIEGLVGYHLDEETLDNIEDLIQVFIYGK